MFRATSSPHLPLPTRFQLQSYYIVFAAKWPIYAQCQARVTPNHTLLSSRICQHAHTFSFATTPFTGHSKNHTLAHIR